MAESAPPQPLDVARAFVQTYYQTLAEDANKMPASDPASVPEFSSPHV